MYRLQGSNVQTIAPIFYSAERKLTALFLSFIMNLRTKAFLELKTLDELVEFIGLSPKFVQHKKKYYKQFKIKKKNGRTRTIYAPTNPLKQVQKDLNYILQDVYGEIRPESTFGFCKLGGDQPNGIFRNAFAHVNQRRIFSVDLRNFFPSIHTYIIEQLFCGPPFNKVYSVSKFLTEIVSYRDALPQGAPSSPIISNFICLQLDLKFLSLSKEKGWNYSRYADDLTFSSQHWFTKEDYYLVTQTIKSLGFKVNYSKIRFKGNCSRQKVTGLIVNKKVNVDRRYIRSLRAMLHNCLTKDIGQVIQTNREERNPPLFYSERPSVSLKLLSLLGRINFVGAIRGKSDPIYQKYLAEFYKIKYTPIIVRNEAKIEKVTVIDQPRTIPLKNSNLNPENFIIVSIKKGVKRSYYLVERQKLFSFQKLRSGIFAYLDGSILELWERDKNETIKADHMWNMSSNDFVFGNKSIKYNPNVIGVGFYLGLDCFELISPYISETDISTILAIREDCLSGSMKFHYQLSWLSNYVNHLVGFKANTILFYNKSIFWNDSAITLPLFCDRIRKIKYTLWFTDDHSEYFPDFDKDLYSSGFNKLSIVNDQLIKLRIRMDNDYIQYIIDNYYTTITSMTNKGTFAMTRYAFLIWGQ
jgi:RNA-directed DNA polymerase